MAIYIVEREITARGTVILGRLGPELSDLSKLANSCMAPQLYGPIDPLFADYAGSVSAGIPNPSSGSESIHYGDTEFGWFGARFYSKYDGLTIWPLVTIHPGPISQAAVDLHTNLPEEWEYLSKEEINKSVISVVFRYNPSPGLRGSRILLNRVMSF